MTTSSGISRRSLLAGAGGLAVAGALGSIVAGAEPAAAATLPRVPRGFRWGVATSGFQSEGYAPDSNWSRYVAKRTASIKQPYLNSVDFRHRYRSDIALAAGLGVNTYRFGIEWARVQPKRGQWDARALAYYDDVVRRIRAAGMAPMITLSHFVHPGWIADQGGWANARTIADFLEFARVIVGRYRRRGVWWITFNESTPYVIFEMQNGGINASQILTMNDNLVRAHRAAYDLIHRMDPGRPVSSNFAYLSGLLTSVDAYLPFLNNVGDKLDFLGMDYYYGATLQNMTSLQAFGGDLWAIQPEPKDLYWALKYYHQLFPKLPVYIVENGMPTDDGKPRTDGYTRSQHLRDHLYWMQRAIGDGVNVIGYNYWSLTDNYEWGSYRPRFGLYTVDVLTDRTLARRPTDAVVTYRDVIRGRGVPANYQPVKKPTFCSLADLPWSCLQLP